MNNPDTSMVGKKPWEITDSSDGSIRDYWKRLSPAIGGGMLSSKRDKSRVSLREQSGRSTVPYSGFYLPFVQGSLRTSKPRSSPYR